MFCKILIPVDGSEPSNHALTYAIEQATQHDAELIVMTVIEPTPSLLYGDDEFPGINIEEYEDAMEKSHKQVLIQAEEKVRVAHPEMKIRSILSKGHVAMRIMEIAGKEDVDLIVMGSRGLSGLSGWVLGSTSRYVVEHCTKPILIVK